jgi:hypothetical protein
MGRTSAAEGENEHVLSCTCEPWMVHIRDDARPCFVLSDRALTAKDSQGVNLHVMTVSSMLSSIPKVAKARNNRTAEPTYPDAFASAPLDLTVSGLRCLRTPGRRMGCNLNTLGMIVRRSFRNRPDPRTTSHPPRK